MLCHQNWLEFTFRFFLFKHVFYSIIYTERLSFCFVWLERLLDMMIWIYSIYNHEMSASCYRICFLLPGQNVLTYCGIFWLNVLYICLILFHFSFLFFIFHFAHFYFCTRFNWIFSFILVTLLYAECTSKQIKRNNPMITYWLIQQPKQNIQRIREIWKQNTEIKYNILYLVCNHRNDVVKLANNF